jgi:hypothetical protein
MRGGRRALARPARNSQAVVPKWYFFCKNLGALSLKGNTAL